MVEIMRMVFLDHYFLFLARKYSQENPDVCEEYLYLTKNMVVKNMIMIHHESLYIEKVVNNRVNHRQSLLFSMGKDFYYNESRERDDEAYFIKIWDFKSLIESEEDGCKLFACEINLPLVIMALNLFLLCHFR